VAGNARNWFNPLGRREKKGDEDKKGRVLRGLFLEVGKATPKNTGHERRRRRKKD